MNYEAIIKKIEFWENYKGGGDEYRKKNEWDCVMTEENLYADTIISLWLPLRYTLNACDCKLWQDWKEYERDNNIRLKNCKEFLLDLKTQIETYLPEDREEVKALSELFEIGQNPDANIMILPYRSWNGLRGMKYFDYLPHFLYDMLDTSNPVFLLAMEKWIKREKLGVFFKDDEDICKENIRDLAGSGAPYRHNPTEINLLQLLNNYNKILKERRKLMLANQSVFVSD